MDLHASQGEVGLYRHIALTTSQVDDEEWDVIDLAKEWLGEVEVDVCLFEAWVTRRARIIVSDIRWMFRMNGHAWWWLTAIVFTLISAGIYIPR